MTKKSTTRRPSQPTAMFAVAACSIALTTSREIQLIPAGEFRGVDGRPKDAPRWFLDAALAQQLIDAANARKNLYVIDYDHQTLLAQKNGQPAPAAGWFKQLEWREGVGLFAVDVEWTERAAAMIEAGEYKYISPVILYDKNGNVIGLLMAAITNNAAIDGMDEVLLAAASQHFASSCPPASLSMEVPSMDDLLEQLRWMLNLPVGSTAEEIQAQLQKLIDLIKQDQAATAAASFDLAHLIASQRATIASLSSTAPDPAKFVPVSVMQNLQTQVAQLSAELNKTKLDGVIQAALDGGKLLPSQEAWAREFGAKDFAALSAYLDSAPPIAALSGTQTGGKPPSETTTPGALTPNQAALCQAFGLSEEAFAQALAAETQR